MKIFTPPQRPNFTKLRNTLFLAGSIDMGEAVEWQTQIIDALKDREVTILNPRRADWDASWKQTPDNKEFVGQVTWELDAQEAADAILFYFAPGSKAPITLFEFGRFGTPHKGIVFCPKEYWRSGNIHIACKRYGVPLFTDHDALIEALRGLYAATAVEEDVLVP